MLLMSGDFMSGESVSLGESQEKSEFRGISMQEVNAFFSSIYVGVFSLPTWLFSLPIISFLFFLCKCCTLDIQNCTQMLHHDMQ